MLKEEMNKNDFETAWNNFLIVFARETKLDVFLGWLNNKVTFLFTYFLLRKWTPIKKRTPVPYENVFLLFEDLSIEIGQFQPFSEMAKIYQPFGTEERGIYTCTTKVIKWARLTC